MNFDNYYLFELRAFAQQEDIPGRSRLNKPELILRIEEWLSYSEEEKHGLRCPIKFLKRRAVEIGVQNPYDYSKKNKLLLIREMIRLLDMEDALRLTP